MTEASVETTWGAPVNQNRAGRRPADRRWEYTEFVVYFEYDRVVHAVRETLRPRSA